MIKHSPHRQLFFFLIFCVFGAQNLLFSQSVNLGTPPVFNFSRLKFKAGTQIWDITQDANGEMWFANNNGLLEFDGTHWRLFPLDNGTIVRAVQAADDGKIYVGGQGDFGYFAPGAQGQLQYHSLKSKLPPADQNFSDVWDIETRPEGVFFRTDNQVFCLQGDKLRALFPANKSLFFMGEWHGQLLVQDSNQKLFLFKNNQFEPLESPNTFQAGRISAILTLPNDTVLITTIKNGIYYHAGGAFSPWVTADDNFLKNNRIFCAKALPDGKIALGTSFNGFVTLDQQRRIYHHVNKKSGLQNNTILSLFYAHNGGIWLGLDNGVDFVDLDSPFSTIFPDGELEGTGYAAEVFGGKIYFGTNTGLFATDWTKYYSPERKQHFTKVTNSEGQVWSLNLFDNQLFMGHHEGAFEISGLSSRQLTQLQGIWRFLPIAPNIAIAGHYNGLAVFKKTGNSWAFDRVLKGFSESCRILAQDAHGDIWMSHPYRGIYRIKINLEQGTDTAEFFGAKDGLPSDIGNHLFKLGDKIVYTGEYGVFDFDENTNRFVPDEKFKQLFGEKTKIKYLNQDQAGNIWYATDTETGVLQIESNALEKKVRRIPIPELNDKLTDGFNFLLPVDANNLFAATGQGFIHFNPAAYKSKDSTLRLVLHEVRLKGQTDSLLFAGHGKQEGPIKLTSQQNSLAFSFSAPDYPSGEFVRYAYYVDGMAKKWSEWGTETDVALSHLRPGDYVFHVKARNQHGVESAELTIPFSISPPWYASKLAYALYILLGLGLIASIIYRQQLRFEQEKQNLQDMHQHREEIHQLNARRSEEAINQLKNEKLEAEINHKTQELASVTMHLVQKNSILSNIQGALTKLQNKVSQPDLEKELGRIIKMMEHDVRVDDDWEHFSKNFDQVHSDFLKRLSEKHNHLSPNDYRLCAYLRMNLSSKEIASLLNISLRGVEASRYRLRKRLNLESDTNLTDYLIRF